MIIDLPPHVEQQLTQTAHNQGLSIGDYITAMLDNNTLSQTKSVAELVKGKYLQGFDGDPVAIQRAMRDE